MWSSPSTPSAYDPAMASTHSAWSRPELIPAQNVHSEAPLSPMFDAAGNLVLAWSEGTVSKAPLSAEYRVRVASRPARDHWREPETLSHLGLNAAFAVDAAGDAAVVWETEAGDQAATRLAPGGWSSPQTVLSPGGENPQVASDSRGDIIVVAPRQGLRRSRGIQVALGTARGTFSRPQRISGNENAFDPQITMDGHGDAAVAWEVDSAQGCLVRAAFRPADAAWSASKTLSDRHEFCGGNQSVTIDASGDAVAVWLAQRGAKSFVESASRVAGGHWSAARVLGSGAGIYEHPRVRMDARGDAIAVWAQPAPEGGKSTIWARIRPHRASWGRPTRIADGGAGPPSLAVNERGDALVAWQGKRGIEALTRAAGACWSTPQHVPSGVSFRPPFPTDPTAALDARGEGIVAWGDSRGISTSTLAAP